MDYALDGLLARRSLMKLLSRKDSWVEREGRLDGFCSQSCLKEGVSRVFRRKLSGTFWPMLRRRISPLSIK